MRLLLSGDGGARHSVRAVVANQNALVSSAAGRGRPVLPNLGHDFLAGQVQNTALASATMRAVKSNSVV